MGTDIQPYQGQGRDQGNSNELAIQRKTTELLQVLWQQYSAERIDRLEAIIKKARLVVDQAPPEGLALCAMLEAWAEVLEDIPTDRLIEYYKRASKRKGAGYSVNGLDIIAEWNRNRENRKLDKHFPPEEQGTWY